MARMEKDLNLEKKKADAFDQLWLKTAKIPSHFPFKPSWFFVLNFAISCPLPLPRPFEVATQAGDWLVITACHGTVFPGRPWKAATAGELSDAYGCRGGRRQQRKCYRRFRRTVGGPGRAVVKRVQVGWAKVRNTYDSCNIWIKSPRYADFNPGRFMWRYFNAILPRGNSLNIRVFQTGSRQTEGLSEDLPGTQKSALTLNEASTEI